MKKNGLTKIVFLLLAVSMILPLIISCDEKSSGESVYDPSKPVELSDFYPNVGGISTKVILNGSNFGSDVSKIKVYFNEKEAAVVGSVGTKLLVLTPKQPGDICNISVVIGDKSVSYKETFNYETRVTVTTVCGKPGTKGVVVGSLAETQFDQVTFLTVDDEDNIFVSNRGGWSTGNKYIMINEVENTSSIVIPDTGYPANQPEMLDDGKTSYIPIDAENTYWTLSPDNMWKPRKRQIVAKPGQSVSIDFKHAFAMCYADKHMYIRAKNGSLIKMDPYTSEAEVVATLMSSSDSYLRFSKKDPNILYLAYTNQHCIYTYNIVTKEHKLYAGNQGVAGSIDGDRLDAEFNEPRQMVVDGEGNLYLADTKNHTIRKISSDGVVSTVIGQAGVSGYQDGTPEEALFNLPQGVAITKDGIIYVADSDNHCVRRLAIE
ncbi:IPT/TIG domain-containing protein [Dysgonomonas mossii]|uniref:IPT/TIG domain-containing protein n=1 Tax=Dysgonomonas mossii TaxID=163665 RepID=UPI0039938639